MERISIEIHFKLEPKDIWSYKKNARIYSRKVITSIRLANIIFAVFSFIIFYGPNLFQTLVNTFFASFVIFPLAERYTLYARHNLFLKRDAAKLGEKHLKINHDGITLSSTTKTFSQKWSSFIRVVKNDSYYFIYDQDERSYIIPIRELSSENEQKFQNLLVEHNKPLIQQETSSNLEKLTKLRVILLIFFVSLAIINQIENAQDSLSPVKEEVYGLFQNIDTETEMEDLLKQKLNIKESVTQKDI
ncbi:YcxB family protein [Ornithinibacillus massiliensis]|uniref:YcxB family protein n=1 Tax=Ornithinibacillus massiliensis TaxID=1944633 RepID=A0ABS5M909_9BACI|nr:YcxB family protein [Ornithinibacillus massiliensis]MBS3678804.1 YcxB family protein [Ornithinibacillus massiliensis]